MNRRSLLAALPAVGVASRANAQGTWPDHAIRVIVPFPPGGPVDGGARVLGQVLTQGLGQPVVIENRAGAGGSIGTEAAARATPDGYTLHFGSTGSLAVNQTLIPNLSYDTRRDFAAISVVSAVPMLMVARTGLAVTNVQDAIAMARAQPNRLTYGTSGPGGAPHLAGELMRQRGNVHLNMVAYRGAAPTMTAIIAQEVDFTFLDPAVLMPHVRDGRMKALAVTGSQRLAALPDYPTLIEAGLAGVEVENWYALLAPAGTPPDRIARIHAVLSTALTRPETMRSYVEQGQRVLNMSPEDSATFIRAEVSKWAEVVRSAGMGAE
jgi:tripartite-type tricarboxylate transporter receptor subunit TctC